jgi:hypothetical protein
MWELMKINGLKRRTKIIELYRTDLRNQNLFIQIVMEIGKHLNCPYAKDKCDLD